MTLRKMRSLTPAATLARQDGDEAHDNTGFRRSAELVYSAKGGILPLPFSRYEQFLSEGRVRQLAGHAEIGGHSPRDRNQADPLILATAHIRQRFGLSMSSARTVAFLAGLGSKR